MQSMTVRVSWPLGIYTGEAAQEYPHFPMETSTSLLIAVTPDFLSPRSASLFLSLHLVSIMQLGFAFGLVFTKAMGSQLSLFYHLLMKSLLVACFSTSKTLSTFCFYLRGFSFSLSSCRSVPFWGPFIIIALAFQGETQVVCVLSPVRSPGFFHSPFSSCPPESLEIFTQSLIAPLSGNIFCTLFPHNHIASLSLNCTS